jgi:hypothetical protein
MAVGTDAAGLLDRLSIKATTSLKSPGETCHEKLCTGLSPVMIMLNFGNGIASTSRDSAPVTVETRRSVLDWVPR